MKAPCSDILVPLPKIEEAVEILKSLGLPKAQQNERSALTLLALANLGPKAKWKATERPLLRTVDIMEFMRESYGKDYKPNSRENDPPPDASPVRAGSHC